MIDVKIIKDKTGIRGYRIKGHANYGKHGEDIICAGVSILSQSVLKSLVEVSKIREDQLIYNINHDTGFMDLLILEDLTSKVYNDSQVLLKSLITGIEMMIEIYPDYIKMSYEEV